MRKEGTVLISSDNTKYQQYKYKTEKELESITVKLADKIFGEDVVYFDLKKKISSVKGTSGIPDGFLIDFKSQKCFIVEVELSSHDIIRHITNQIFRFKVALTNKITREELTREFYERLQKKDNETYISINDLANIVHKPFGIVIIIDDVTEQLTEIVSVLSQDGTEVIAVPFVTYIDNDKKQIHKFTTFTKATLEQEAKKWTFKWSDHPIDKHLEKTARNLQKIFALLSKEILTLPNAKEKSRKSWVTFQTSPLKNFCTVKFLPDSLEIHLKCDESFLDKKAITKKITRTPAWTFDRVFNISNEEEIQDAMNLIKQSYTCTCCT